MRFASGRALEEAERAYNDGDLSDSVTKSLSVDSVDAKILASRALLLLRRYREAKDVASGALRRYERELKPAARSRLHCLLGASLVRLKRYDSANIELRRASLICEACVEQELRCEILIQRAAMAWFQRRFLDAATLAPQAMDCASPETRIQAFIVLAMTDAGAGNFQQATVSLNKALQECDRTRRPVAVYRALILWDLSGAVAASGSIEDFPFLESSLLAMTRAGDLRIFKARGLKNLTRYYRQCGRLLDVARIAQVLLLIGNQAERVSALSLCGDVALSIGDFSAAEEHFWEAETIVRSIGWKTQDWESQCGLLELACRLSRLSPLRAATILNTYRVNRNEPHPIYLDGGNSTLLADELRASGAILAGFGDLDKARANLCEAMKLYGIMGINHERQVTAELLTRIGPERGVARA